MFVSVIVATRNRSYAIKACLDAIGAALRKLDHAQGEIIVVDNGSSDGTHAVVEEWRATTDTPLLLLFEPRPGLSRAQNLAIAHASGDVLVFTDDDCRMDAGYIAALADATAMEARTVTGGRVELGDERDLPVTVVTHPSEEYWLRQDPGSSHRRIAGSMIGCNLAIPKSAFIDLGGFDEEFGSGAYINSGGDTDFLYRAYLAGYTLRYNPALVVHHHHGRRSPSEARKLRQGLRGCQRGLGGAILAWRLPCAVG